MSNFYFYFYAVWLVLMQLNMIGSILAIGEPREPFTKTGAISATVHAILSLIAFWQMWGAVS